VLQHALALFATLGLLGASGGALARSVTLLSTFSGGDRLDGTPQHLTDIQLFWAGQPSKSDC
jgi:hypothetical protein